MSKRLLYSVWGIASLSMLLFGAGFICWQLGLGWLTSWLYAWAGKTLFVAFALLLVLALVAMLRAVAAGCATYFASESVALRRLLTVYARQQNQVLQQTLQTRQLRYFSEFKRQRLLAADNKRQLRGLFMAVNAELKAARAQLPVDSYRALHKALRQHFKQADAQAILAVRKQIVCR